MYKVKLIVSSTDEKCNRQLPNNGFIWKDYQFYINDEIEEADFLVVCFQKFPNKTERCKVAPENTLFFTWEPDSTYHYSQRFLNQFAKVVSCQQKLKHRNLVHDQPGLAWHIGMERKNGEVTYSHNYDSLSKSHPQKTKLISVISSNKAFTKGHRERIEFVKKIKDHYGDLVDIYGRGFNNFGNKWDVIAPYKYHISLENCSIPDYWSEKLSDSYLANAFPFYYGCTNIEKYFNESSFCRINIKDISGAIETIDNALSNNYAETRYEDVEKAKQKVLNEYNIFAAIVKHIEGMNPNAAKKDVVIKQDMAFFDIWKVVLVIKRFFNKLTYKIFNCGN
ncbi:MAG: hypothetical protein IKO46_00955 [Salinivirgaceae bacterium]|nr:hypothetical protein [Salinivirgaceae bacterium]